MLTLCMTVAAGFFVFAGTVLSANGNTNANANGNTNGMVQASPTATPTPVQTVSPTPISTPTPTPVVGSPDLVANDITTYQSVYTVGSPIDVMGSIYNGGTAAASQFNAAWYLNNVSKGSAMFQSLAVGGLVGVTPFTWVPTAVGSYSVRLAVDEGLAVKESNEMNNVITKTITVAAAPVVSPSPSPTPTVTPTPTVSPTPVVSPTPAVVYPSPTPSPTVSPTPRVSPTPAVSPTPRPTVSPTPSVSPRPVPTVTPIPLPNDIMTPPAGFIRGDVNGDGKIYMSDAVAINSAIYLGSYHFSCLDAADANDDGLITESDSVYILNYLFKGGSAPASPFAVSGADPTLDLLGCKSIPAVNRIAKAVNQKFLRGDVDKDGKLTMNDTIYISNFLAGTGKRPSCLDAADVNDDGYLTKADYQYFQGYLFLGTHKTLPQPYKVLGDDSTPDNLDCESYTGTPAPAPIPVPVGPSSPTVAPATVAFRRGDINSDGSIDQTDLKALVDYLQSSVPISCLDAADVDDNGRIENTDLLDWSLWKWQSSYTIPAPGPYAVGLDPTADSLGCDAYPAPKPAPMAVTRVTFRRGDINSDGSIDQTDLKALVDYLQSSVPISCLDAADVDDNGRIDQTDLLDWSHWKWLSSYTIPAPGPYAVGVDPTEDNLGCVAYPAPVR